MNSLEQRVRHLAVAETQRQLEDLQTVVTEMATVVHELDGRIVALAEIVKGLESRFRAFAQGTADAYDALADRLQDTRGSVGQLHTETRLLTESTIGQRLRWITIGTRKTDDGEKHVTRRVTQADQPVLQSSASADAGDPRDCDDAA